MEENSKSSVFVAGGTGFVGKHLINHLAGRGYALIALARDPSKAEQSLHPACTIVAGDPTIPGEWQERAGACDFVINLAGEPVVGRWSPKKKERIRESRLSAASNIADAINRSRHAKALIAASAIGYYPSGTEEALREGHGPGHDFLATVCTEWEAASMQASPATRVVILRIGLVLYRDGGILQRLVPVFRRGFGGPIGDGGQWMSWIHMRDLVRLAEHAMTNTDLAGPVNATAPLPVLNKSFAQALARSVGRFAMLPAPSFALRLLFGEGAEPMLASQRVIPQAAINSGFKFDFPDIEAAIRDAVSRE